MRPTIASPSPVPLALVVVSSELNARRCCARGSLLQFFARWNLSRLKKSFDQFAFAADRPAGKLLEPFSFRHFGFGIEPVGQQPKLIGGNVATMDPINQMRQKLRWKIVAADARHGYSP